MSDATSTAWRERWSRLQSHARIAGLLSVLLASWGVAGCGGEGDGQPSSDGGIGGASSGGAAAGGSSTGGDGTGGSAEPSTVCAVPEPSAIPAAENVVGTGSAGSCTEAALRTAVTAGGHLTFACGDGPVTIPVAQAIQVTQPTVIDGADQVTLDGGGTSQILIVASNQSLSVRNLRFVNGVAPATMEAEGIGGAVAGNWRSSVEVIGCTFEGNRAGRGGGAVAVWTGSSLVVVDSTFVGNTSWYGGAVYSLLSPLTIVNSVFTGNVTVTDGGLGDGGAIGTDGASESPDDTLGGDVVICGTRIENSQGTGSGGGAYIWVYPPDRVTIDRTTVAGNSVDGLGGAMRISNGEIVVKDSSFLSNTSTGNGAGFYLDCAPTCRITNSTFYDNRSDTYGGAIFGDGYETNNVTFADNYAGGHGGALFGSGFTLHNTVFVDNAAGNPWGQAMSCSTTGSGDHVLQWLSASSSAGSDSCIATVIAGDPRLAQPADNGGSTVTMLPGAGSAVLGAGAGCEATDQRGQPRGTAVCDLGSVEVL
jgi:predicted outer membrane repeat protein